MLVHWIVVLGVWAALLAGGFIAYHWAQLPATDAFYQPQKSYSVTIYDAQQRLIGRRGIDAGLPVKLEELPDYVGNAVIATEDRRFYDHFGLDLAGVARALWVNFEAGKVKQGGSTITQQLAKNLFLSSDRTMSRKIQEAMLAFYLEQRYSKDEIITLYLNQVYFGAGAYGVDAAARRYFGKPASQLTLKEAAILAGLLKAPSRYSPVNDLELSYQRAGLVLNEMLEAGFITEAQRRDADATRPKMFLDAGDSTGQYFIDYVMERLPSFVGEPNMDVVVQTTLDLDWQRDADTAMVQALTAQGAALGVTQGAMVALTADGAIRAMVGGRSYAASVFNRATQARRQPGSAFKPFVFLAALEGGMSPDDIVQDAPFTKRGWTPQNFEKGPPRTLTLEQALAQSVNTVTARLTDQFGARTVRDTAQRLGISSELDAVDSIGLGTEEVTLLELTGAYAAFANRGVGVIPFGIQTITGADGTVLYHREGTGLGAVIAPAIAASIHRILTEAVASGTGRRARLANRPTAGKTGTTQDFRDAWFVGYSGPVITGVWTGNDRPVPMRKVTGGSFPTLIWKAFMTAALDGGRVVPPYLQAAPDAPAIAAPSIVDQALAAPPGPAPAAASPPVAPEAAEAAAAAEAPADEPSQPAEEPVLAEPPPETPQHKDASLRDDPMAKLIRANAQEPATSAIP
jgi:penicillin-binding protein 1A